MRLASGPHWRKSNPRHAADDAGCTRPINVLNCLPKLTQAKAKQALHAISQTGRPGQIESTFATIRHGTRRSRGCLTRNGMLHMMFKLGQCIEKCWRRLRRFLDRAKVITDVKFNDGIEVSNLDQTAA